jgi:hypothetical protein
LTVLPRTWPTKPPRIAVAATLQASVCIEALFDGRCNAHAAADQPSE